MYSYEDRRKAVELYIKYGLRAAATIRELGYPDRHSLSMWYKEYITNGDLHPSLERTPKFSKEQRKIALEHYVEHGRSITYTVKSLGYPSRGQLLAWVREEFPNERPSCRSGQSLVNLSQKEKEEAVVDLCARKGSAQEIAERYGMSRTALYGWKRQLLDKDGNKVMPRIKKRCQTTPETAEELKNEISRLQEQADELNREVFRLQIERDVLEKAAEIIKKDQGVSLKTLTNKEKAIVIDALRDKYRLKDLLSVFYMAKSSYCYQETVMRTSDKYEHLRKEICKAFIDSRKTYGYRRINSVLKSKDIGVSEKVVRRIMKEEHLTIVIKRRRKYNSYKGEITPAPQNVINRDFHADRPNQKWLTDITEFHIPAGKVYLSPIIDCFDGLPIAWTISTSPDAELTNTMLDNAIDVLKNDEHPIVHSDRGCHYRWPGWIERMEAAGLIRSMSKKGCSPDNSACEGFFGRLKNEMFYNRKWDSVGIEQFMDTLNEYIQWYARDRIKISLGGLSPIAYRKQLGLVS
jgi:transposase InsO family protein/transposase-like protein